MGTGHVFVARGDIRSLNVDAWLLPTDKQLTITETWRSPAVDAVVDSLKMSGVPDEFTNGDRFAVAAPNPSGPTPILTAVPFEGAEGFEDLEARLRSGLREAALVAKTADAWTATSARSRRLIATPAFGVGGGGADAARGDVIAGILRVAGEVAEREGVDIVLCLWRGVDHALAQSLRVKVWKDEPPVDQEKWDRVNELAAKSRAGKLVPFMGAGVSASAGLPTWRALLVGLSQGRITDDDASGWFQKLSALDQAQVVRGGRGREEFGESVREHTSAERYGLAPLLLAGLPGDEAVTLNYDDLYERASADAGRSVAVLPFDGLADSDRWLLKMHGCVTRPESIVLTRADYIDFRSQSATAASLARAMLMTKHLLFVGFGLSDDHFHDLVHEVGTSREKSATFGTALVLGDARGHRAVWGDRIQFVTFQDGQFADQARELEIYLDVLGALSTETDSLVLDDRFASVIQEEERNAKELFLRLLKENGPVLDGTVVGRALLEVKDRLTGQSCSSPAGNASGTTGSTSGMTSVWSWAIGR
ncbi:SIR2 family protein [Tessaracoccus terricola]